MESKIAIQKGEQPKPANPQFFLYFILLCMLTIYSLATLSPVLTAVLRNRKSPIEAPIWVFLIMTIVTIVLTILESVTLVSTSYYFKSYMKNIHYTFLKSIGMLSGFLVFVSTGCAIFVTDELNWRYSVMGIIFNVILVLYYFVWKYTLNHQENKRFNEFPVDWTLLLVGLFVVSVPLMTKLHIIMPKELFWVHFIMTFLQLSALVPAILRLVRWYNTRRQGTSSLVIKQDSQTETIIHP